MDPVDFLLLLFVPVPVVLVCAIIVLIYDGKRQPYRCKRRVSIREFDCSEPRAGEPKTSSLPNPFICR